MHYTTALCARRETAHIMHPCHCHSEPPMQQTDGDSWTQCKRDAYAKSYTPQKEYSFTIQHLSMCDLCISQPYAPRECLNDMTGLPLPTSLERHMLHIALRPLKLSKKNVQRYMIIFAVMHSTSSEAFSRVYPLVSRVGYEIGCCGTAPREASHGKRCVIARMPRSCTRQSVANTQPLR